VGFTAKGTVPPFIIALAPGLFKGLETYFSYLKTDGLVYTITKTIWLNDIINNPLYRGLIDQFNTFQRWRTKEREKINKLYEKQKGILETDANTVFSDVRVVLMNNLSEKANTLKDQRNTQYVVTNQQLIGYINDFYKILSDTSGGSLLLDNITNLRSLYNELKQNNISIREEIRKKINPVFDKAKRVDNLGTIFTKYFESGIDINFEDDEESVRTLLRTNYGEYVKFVENLKKFITPNKESNNTQLQSLIEDYIEGTKKKDSEAKPKDFPTVIAKISKTFLGKHIHKRVDKNDDISDYVKVDYTTTETITEGEPKTELYLAVDVVKGELTDSNLRRITCNYRGEELTDRFDHIRKKWAYNPFEIDKKRLFFDFEKVLAAKEPVKKGKDAPPIMPPGAPPPAILAQGGKKYTRNKKVKRMRNLRITQRMRR
jgi:hypothetical protein